MLRAADILLEAGIVMESGRVLMTGPADTVLNNPQMADLYFGGSVKKASENDQSAPDAVPTRP